MTPPLLERLYEALAAADVDAALGLYGDDAQVVRFSGIATGRDEIRRFLEETLRSHGTFVLQSIDDLVATDDLIEVDATVETDAGLLQTSEVFMLDGSGQIHRHVPAIRGYWGM